MDSNRNDALTLGNPDSPDPQSPPRRFVYRAVEPSARQPHPLRRSTDTPHHFQGVPGQLCPNPLLLKFRVFVKVN